MAINESKGHKAGPPSIRQKQILDVAAANPDMAMEDLAAEIPSATTELVESVLDEYGDPAGDESTLLNEEDEEAMDKGHIPDLADLTTKQREALRAIARRPSATQRELADMLDVSGPTVSNRVNSIDGFDWEDRESFANGVFDSTPDPAETTSMATNGAAQKNPIEQLTDRVLSIEEQLSKQTTEGDGSQSGFGGIDPELAHKIAHASLMSDAITEEEELQIMKALLQ